MLKNILLTFLLFYGSSLLAQNEANVERLKAKIALTAKDTTKALAHYKKYIRANPRNPYDYFKIAQLASATGDYSFAYTLLTQALEKGLPPSNIQSKKLAKFKASPHWEKLHITKDNHFQNYHKSLDQDWIMAIKNMVYIDQEIRRPYMKSLRDSILKEKTLFAMQLVDSINFAHLLKLTKEKGFPNYQTVGYQGVNDTWLLLWHHRGKEFMENPMWVAIKPFIRKEIDKGLLPKDFLTLFEDYYAVETDQPMIYGTLYGYYRRQPEYHQLKVKEVHQLNARRKAVGLAPVELWIQSMKLSMPEGIKALYQKK